MPRRFKQAFDDPDEIAAHGAADAAIVHFEHFLVGANDEIVVDADFAEFIDDDGELPAMVLGENAVQKRRLAGAEIAGEHGDGNFFGHVSLREAGRGAAHGANIGDARASANRCEFRAGQSKWPRLLPQWRLLDTQSGAN